MGTLQVNVNKGKVWSKKGNQGDQWKSTTINLDKYSGYTCVDFVGIVGRSYTSDAAIDDVTLYRGKDSSPPPATPPPATPPPATPAPTPPPPPPPAPTGDAIKQEFNKVNHKLDRIERKIDAMSMT